MSTLQSVFDLLDIPLVHGWLVDPQDAPTAAAVGHKSYNELVVQVRHACTLDLWGVECLPECVLWLSL